jgi:hypothetical protein
VSYNLALWAEPIPASASEALALYRAIHGSAAIGPKPSRRIDGFRTELAALWPDLDTIADDDELDRSPWSAGFDVTDRSIELVISPSSTAEVIPVVASLAAKHGLVCFDPQEMRTLVPL